MGYKYKKNQLFGKRLKVPKSILSKVYSSNLTFEEFIKYKLEDKIPTSCIRAKDRVLVEKFGLEKCRNLDWKLLNDYFFEQEWQLRDLLLSIDSNTPNPNIDIYNLIINDIAPEHYSPMMKEIFTDRYFKINPDEHDGYLKRNFNYGILSLKEIIDNWYLFKNMNFDYHLMIDSKINDVKLNTQQVRLFMSEFPSLSRLIIEHSDIYEFINHFSADDIPKEDKDQYIRNFAEEILNKTFRSERNIYPIELTEEQYREIFKYASIEEHLTKINKYNTPPIFEELKTLPKEYIFNTPFPISVLIKRDVLNFIGEFGLKNIVDFDNECGHFFSKNNCEMLELMFEMYLHYGGNEHDPQKNIFSTSTSARFNESGEYLGRIYTKDEFYESMRRMIIYGPNNWEYIAKAPDYREMTGEFRVRNSKLFISEEAPEELQKLFYTKSITPQILVEHSEYIPYLNGKDLGSCFKSRSIQVEKYESIYEYKNIYDFLGTKTDFNSMMNFIIEYNDILNIIYDKNLTNNYRYELKFSREAGMDEIKKGIAETFKNIITENFIAYPSNIPKDIIEKYPSMFLSPSAPEELKEAFYSRTIDTRFILSNEQYREFLRQIDLELLYKYMPIKIKKDKYHYEYYNSANLVSIIKQTFGSEEAFDIMLTYGEYIESIFEINKLIRLEITKDCSKQEMLDYLDSEILKAILLDKMKYDENMPSHFKNNNTKLFLSPSAPEELKEAFYGRTINSRFILSNKNYKEYLKNIDLQVLYKYMPIKIKKDNTESYESTNIVKIVQEKFSPEEAFDILLAYGEYIEFVYTLNKFSEYEINQDCSKNDLLDCMDSLILDAILSGKIKYDDNVPSHFKNNNLTLFLNQDVPKDIRDKFYNRKFTIEDFESDPKLLEFFGNTNVACGLSESFHWAISLFNNNEDQKIANKKRLNIVSEYSKITDEKLRRIFKEYVTTNKDDFTIEKIDKISEVLKRLLYSNSIEMYSFRENLATQLLETDDPVNNLEKIEKVFLQNNLPLCGKMFLCFQILYPNLDKDTVFDFGEDSRIAPELKDLSLPNVGFNSSANEKRKILIFNDLLRIAYRSNERSFMEYLNNIEAGNDIYFELQNNNYQLNQLSSEQMQIFKEFIVHLEVLYQNTNNGKELQFNFNDMTLEQKTKILGDAFRPNNRYELKDRIVRSFCYTAGIRSFDELKQLAFEAKKEQSERKTKFIEKINQNGGKFKFEEGDFVRGIGYYDILGSTLNSGNVSKEHLGVFQGKSDSDTTPLDVDLTLITNTSDIYHAIDKTPTGFGFGNLFIILKKDNPSLNVTRDKNGNLTGVLYDPRKIETFGTSMPVTGGYATHWGARTGIAFTDVDCILYKKNKLIDSNQPYDDNGNVNYVQESEEYDDLPAIKYEIAKNGYYIPVIDFSGKLIFTEKEYDDLRKKMQGLSYFGEKNYKLSNNLITPEIENIASTITVETMRETEEKRAKINAIIKEVLDEFGYDIKFKMDGDLTTGSVEFIDTGSTGRNTNVPHDGDFDFFMRLDADLMRNENALRKFKNRLMEKIQEYPMDQSPTITDMEDYRFKGVRLDDNTKVDIDISFGIKTNKITYSSDECLKDRLNSIYEQSPEQYKYVVANIILAKKVLKEAGCYKPKRTDKEQGGIGGVGIENWILQHGGSFEDAATSFLAAAEGKTFEEFKNTYEIWDFGQNHFAARRGNYPHDNFIACNMSETGYTKMKEALSTYFKQRELSAMQETGPEVKPISTQIKTN